MALSVQPRGLQGRGFRVVAASAAVVGPPTQHRAIQRDATLAMKSHQPEANHLLIMQKNECTLSA